MGRASSHITWLLGAVVFAAQAPVAAADPLPLRLAEDGRTRYRIIIPREAEAAEEFAAKELGGAPGRDDRRPVRHSTG